MIHLNSLQINAQPTDQSSKSWLDHLKQQHNSPADKHSDHPQLADKVVMITGATKGLGFALAQACAQQGATVLAFGRQTKGLEALVGACQANNAKTPIIQPIDWLKVGIEHLTNLTTQIHAKFGRIDALIHTAAQVGRICPIDLLPPSTWLETQHLNTNIPFLLTQQCYSLLQASTRANVIWLGDQECEQAEPIPYWSAYQHSKQALTLQAKQFADAWHATNINCHLLSLPCLQTGLKLRHFPGCRPSDYLHVQQVLPILIELIATDRPFSGYRLACQATETANVHQQVQTCD